MMLNPGSFDWQVVQQVLPNVEALLYSGKIQPFLLGGAASVDILLPLEKDFELVR
ncbi:hypothetical protein D3C87_2008800 [compost metagenome]